MTDTDQPTNQEPLLSEFHASSPEEWREAAEKLLKGAPYDKVMRTKLVEGFTQEPIFWREDLERLPQAQTRPGADGYLRGTKAAGYAAQPWEIAQELPYGDPIEFNRALMADLMRGQTAINVLFDIATLSGKDPDEAKIGDVGACGLSVASVEDLRRALEGLVPNALGCHFRTGCSGLAIAAMFFAWLEEKGVHRNEVKGSFNMDPLATWAAAGSLPISLSGLLNETTVLADYCSRHAPGMRAVGVSTIPYHQAGGSAVEELGFALAAGVEYLKEMTERQLDPSAAAQQIRFSFSLGSNFFVEVAKLRAARMLWAQAVKAFGGDADAQKISLHARTGLHNKTQFDPYVNMLRNTTEALSGVIGGVDSLCVGTFDEVIGTPDVFSRRIARNTQIILQEECELTAVADPAGGSWAIEWLTEQVAERAWKLFQETEKQGGFAQALENGFVAETLAKPAAERTKLLNQRRVSLVGTNVYPNSTEKSTEAKIPDYAELRAQRAKEVQNYRLEMDEETDALVLAKLDQILHIERDQILPTLIEAVSAGATLGEVTRALRGGHTVGETIPPLPHQRLAADYEALRKASRAYAEKNGFAPRIYLTCIGALRKHKLRADFTISFFASGGFEILQGKGETEAQEAAKSTSEAGAPITVICGTDDDYVDFVPAFCKAMKIVSPNTKLVLAGNPGDKEAAYKDAGLDDYIFVKSDNYATNRKYLEEVGAL